MRGSTMHVHTSFGRRLRAAVRAYVQGLHISSSPSEDRFLHSVTNWTSGLCKSTPDDRLERRLQFNVRAIGREGGCSCDRLQHEYMNHG